MTEMWSIGLVIFGTIIGSLGPIMLKKGSGKLNRKITSQLKNKSLILGLIIYITSAIIFIPALKGGELSLLYPLVSLGYVWVSILSMIILKEKMNKIKWLGVLLILVGVTFIGLGSEIIT